MNALAAPAPLISVIIAARNAEATLDKTLDSLLMQTVKQWEAIIIDDGSADGTAEIALDYAARDPRSRLLRVRACGAAAARNVGLAAARGAYVVFLDADDWIDPTHFERLFGMLAEATEAGAAYCAFRRVAPNGDIGPITWRSDIAEGPTQAFANRPGTAIHAVLVERARVVAIGGFDLRFALARIGIFGSAWPVPAPALSALRSHLPSIACAADPSPKQSGR